jgi:hypothetical protein
MQQSPARLRDESAFAATPQEKKKPGKRERFAG